MSRPGGESGQVSAFVISVTLALLFVAGLVLDGGALLTAKRQAINDAEQAARAGAQGLAIEQARAAGAHTLDAQRATAAAQEYLARIGRDGSVTVDSDRVAVTVTLTRQMAILGLAGRDEITITGTAEARNVRGLREGET